MNIEELKRAHPKACQAIVEQERDRVLAHLDIGTHIDCPVVAHDFIRSGASLASAVAEYTAAASKHGTTEQLEWRLKYYSSSLAAPDALTATPQATAPKSALAEAARSGALGHVMKTAQEELDAGAGIQIWGTWGSFNQGADSK